jgi:hypothetical protein
MADRFMPEDVWSALVTARLAGELALPAGNLWEPPMARWLRALVAAGYSREGAVHIARGQLGLMEGDSE